MNIILIVIDGLGIGSMPNALVKANTWQRIQNNVAKNDLKFLTHIMQNAAKLKLDYVGADSYLGHLTMSGIKTNFIKLNPLEVEKAKIINKLKQNNYKVYEKDGLLIVNDSLVIYDNFEATHGLAINIAGIEDLISFNNQLRISQIVRNIVKNPRVISFTAKNILLSNYLNHILHKNNFHGIDTPKTNVYNDTFKVEHLPFITNFKRSTQYKLFKKGYKIFMYGKFGNIIRIPEFAKISTKIKVDDIFKELFQNLLSKNKSFHCINIQETDLAGHLSNIPKFISILKIVDLNIKKLIKKQVHDIIRWTADHWNDPGIQQSLHTREYVPGWSNIQFDGKLLSDISNFILNNA